MRTSSAVRNGIGLVGLSLGASIAMFGTAAAAIPAGSGGHATKPAVWIPDFEVRGPGSHAMGGLSSHGSYLYLDVGYVDDTACDSYGALLQIYAGKKSSDVYYDSQGCHSTAEFTSDPLGSRNITYVRVRACRARRDALGGLHKWSCGPLTRVNKKGHW